jgi:hypothetical protein
MNSAYIENRINDILREQMLAGGSHKDNPWIRKIRSCAKDYQAAKKKVTKKKKAVKKVAKKVTKKKKGTKRKYVRKAITKADIPTQPLKEDIAYEKNIPIQDVTPAMVNDAKEMIIEEYKEELKQQEDELEDINLEEEFDYSQFKNINEDEFFDNPAGTISGILNIPKSQVTQQMINKVKDIFNKVNNKIDEVIIDVVNNQNLVDHETFKNLQSDTKDIIIEEIKDVVKEVVPQVLSHNLLDAPLYNILVNEPEATTELAQPESRYEKAQRTTRQKQKFAVEKLKMTPNKTFKQRSRAQQEEINTKFKAYVKKHGGPIFLGSGRMRRNIYY